MRRAPQLQVTADERTQLQQWARGRRTPVRLALRANMILLAGEGRENRHIAAAVGMSRQTVGLWRQRFVTYRLAGLEHDAPRGGRPPRVGKRWRRRSFTPPPKPVPRLRRTGPRGRWPGTWGPIPA